MIERLTKMKETISHRMIYGGLAGCHLWAAWMVAKPEVYLPMAAVYALAAWKG